VNKVGILHPGEMGFAVANSVLNSGHEVYWCSEGRSEATRQRAQTLNLSACSTLDELCRTCGILISVCPPHAALDMAQAVKDSGFRGLYADINAIAPNTMKTLADNLQTTGITVIDGGIIGLPPVSAGTTWLHLSGHGAEQVADCFSAGPMETSILGPEIGQASGLKMCFAANSKGTAALHAAILGAADNLGVREALERQWDTYTPGFTAKAHG
jgi:3-hydroxyisobutyrate dehydrogenase-like beta-hydroxyacid dehydrogenase